MIFHKNIVIKAAVLFSFLIPFTSFSQTISYIIPDIGSAGQNTYIEIIGPYNQNGNFGTDGLYLNNPGDAVRVICANNADTNTIKLGPAVVSWSGRMISTQVFVMQGVQPNSTDWKQLNTSFKIPIQVMLNGSLLSNADTFYVVQPQAAIITAAAGTLGSGGAWGIRSRRGAMIFDSLVFQNGAIVSIDKSDSDPVTPGNQGYLPINVISRGRVVIDNGAMVINDAQGGQNTDGAAGGGGGGTESFTNCSPGAGGVNRSGDGFTGGGTELLKGEQPGGGTGSTPAACASVSGISLNGVPGGKSQSACGVDEGGGGGGTGHPFGSSGGRDGDPGGGYGGGSGYSGYGGGGFASDGTTPGTNEFGKAHGNAALVPFAGGSGGGAGVAGSGTSRGGGGGGGGAITLHAHLTTVLNATGRVSGNGGSGVIGCGGYRGGGGGSGGGIILTGKLSALANGTLSAAGGAGGVGGGGSGGAGGAGRVRLDGPFTSAPSVNPVPGANSSSEFVGPSTDTTMYVDRSYTLTGTGNGQPINIYLKPMTKSWQLVATINSYGTSWTHNFVFPCPDTAFLLVAAQQIAAPDTAPYTAEPDFVFSQAAANYIVVKNALKAHAGNDTSLCPGSCLTIGAHPAATGGVPPYSYLWHPHTSPNDSTSANPTICVFSSITYGLTITDSSGCFNTDSIKLDVYSQPVANFSMANICSNSTAIFYDSSTVASGSISTWSWNFGDGSPLNTSQNPTHNFTNAGTYSVTLIVTTTDGCVDSVTQNIVVHPLPIVIFNTNNVCNQKPAIFVDFTSIPATDTLQSWAWNFGDASPVYTNHLVTGGHLYADTGTYTVKLIVASNFGCIDSASQSVIVRPNPVAYFKNTSVCNGAATVFIDSSSTANGSLSLWKWEFGDSTSADFTQNPSHVYIHAGLHPVTLVVQNNFGCADTLTKNVNVFFNPVASFTHADVCFKDSMYFTSTSYIDTSSSLAHYFWSFNDGATSTLANPVHYYALPGTYQVTLVVKTLDSCSNATTISVNVFDPPVSHFNVNDVCLFDSAAVSNTSVNPAVGTINNWSWSFGDGTPVNTTYWSPHHLYGVTGRYAIQLITYSSNLGCADTLVDSITVFPMPVAGFSSVDECLGQAIHFSDLSVVPTTDTITTWGWDFGGGSAASALQNPVRIFSNYGTYGVTLLVATNHGCKDTVNHTAIVHPKPTTLFNSDDVCLGSLTSFVDSSFVPTNSTNDVLLSWTWMFGDNSFLSNNQNTTHLYDTTGTFSVQLLAVTDFGCADSISKIVTVNPNPEVNFSANDTIGCEPLCITLQDASIISSGGNESWLWDVGDNTSEVNGAQINHCYHNDSIFAPNYYSVTLSVTSDNGCTSTATKTNYITVYPLPHAAFVAQPISAIITNPVITLTDLSVGANFWRWNLGDTDTNLIMETPPSHTYADTGSYIITLLTATQYQCLDSTQQTITIEPDFIFYIPNSFSPNDDGVNDSFTGKGIFIKEFEMSIFDRWGNLIYKTDDIDKPWDGKVNKGNQPAQQDVYIYSVVVTDFKLLKHTYRGTVTLIK
jgi:gliding motility-associated-like protein